MEELNYEVISEEEKTITIEDEQDLNKYERVIISTKFNAYADLNGCNPMAIYVSEEDLKDIENGTKCFDVDNNCIVDYDNTEYTKQEVIRELRVKRQTECFSIINRGQLWYDNLTDKQKEELKIWYTAWLDVTKTLVEPTKPEWLK